MIKQKIIQKVYCIKNKKAGRIQKLITIPTTSDIKVGDYVEVIKREFKK